MNLQFPQTVMHWLLAGSAVAAVTFFAVGLTLYFERSPRPLWVLAVHYTSMVLALLQTAGVIFLAPRSDGFVALGCVVKGETDHYEYVCQQTMRGLTDLAIKHMAAIGNGILTVRDKKQATTRATQGNKGGLAALACLAMVALKNQLGVSGR